MTAAGSILLPDFDIASARGGMHMWRNMARALAGFLILAFIAFSQTNTGTLTGTVMDPSGAAIQNVEVSVVQTETNFESRVTTNSDGLYRVQSLLPGTYRL